MSAKILMEAYYEKEKLTMKENKLYEIIKALSNKKLHLIMLLCCYINKL